MKTLNVQLIGRFGNQMFIYASARAYAERNNMELRTQRWIGERIFDIPITPEPCFEDRSLVFDGYCQNQESLTYTRKQVKQWFRYQPWLDHELRMRATDCECVAHRRVGDYFGYGYVVVSLNSYDRARDHFELPKFSLCTEEDAKPNDLPPELQWILDWDTMRRAKYLLRGNSCFSWWAGTLGEGKVYAPVITGLEGGKEQDCDFVEGNWPKFCDLPNITDLHLKEE